MAFWVVDGGRPLGVTATVAATATATGRGPYYVGGKRRVSVSEGGDGFTFDTKRTRFADELPYDAYDNAPISAAVAAPSGYASSDHASPYYPQPQPAFHSGVHIINKAYPHNQPFDHEDEFLYNEAIENYPPLILSLIHI